MTLHIRRWATLGGITLGAVGATVAFKSLLPLRLPIAAQIQREKEPWEGLSFPDIEVYFLRCGYAQIPTFLGIRGEFSLAPRGIAYSAVLIRHPRATFLYDTGLCEDIQSFIEDQSWLFRRTLAAFTMEQSLGKHLQQLELGPSHLDFVVLSHLHWDHVGGIPDLPGVPLRVRRLEYDSAGQEGLFERGHGLIRRLMGKNPLDFFELNGPAYGGFASSLDLFGDGSIVLVPLPGHTLGQVGMFIHRNNGAHLFLIADAAWLAENYIVPTPMHSLFWSRISSDDKLALRTLVDLHHFSRRHPEIPTIPLHDARMQQAVMLADVQSREAQRW